jgi:hypothetical protein
VKKWILVLSLLFLPCLSFAIAPAVWLSSNTTTTDTTQVLCGQYSTPLATSTLHGWLHEVVISSPAVGGSVTIYNSTFTTTGARSVGPITTLVYPNEYLYDVDFPNGMIYSTTGGAQVQILYQCY